MEITVLGSGTAIPDPERGSPGMAVVADDAVLLLDCGSGSLQMGARFGVPVDQADGVLLTHLHPDHTGDLVPLLFAFRNPELDRQKGLFILGPEGLRDFLARLEGAYGEWVHPRGYRLEVKSMGTGSLCFGKCRVRSIPVDHGLPCLAYEISDAAGRRLVYCGDTDYCPSLAGFAVDADLLVLECSFPEGEHHAGHLTPSLAGRMARDARCKQLMLTHFYPACRGKDLLTPCRDVFDGPVLLAEDGLTLRV